MACRYTGQREEATLGLYDYRARWYDPVLGRFIQPDSIVPEPGNPQSLNRYSYAGNNPVTYIDVDGHFPFFPLIGILLFVLMIPGDSGGPYDVPPANQAVADIGLRMAAEPYDWYATYRDCRAGQCDFVDVALTVLPFVPGGVRKATDLVDARHATEVGSLRAAREALEAGDDTLVSKLPSWQQSILRGVVTERRVLDRLGMVGRRRMVEGMVDGVMVRTIPDFIDDTGKVLGEVKDVAKLGWTKQIHAQYDAANRLGYTYRIYVRHDTKIVGYLRKIADEKLIQIEYIENILK